ncbi:HNH endonuclease [Methanoculleus sp.]|jgi:5-methylcytosine-specific restriction protein A|uniref:HNH endonuclease n=1 Tax=Methanoculleus sp. TaxID=90427 RepID=UPI001BD5B807|nr:HNH endonuclease [Methanoculleus sp.]
MTHSNIAKIEETISSLLPDEDYRQACLSLFVESLLEANSYGCNKWGVYCYSEGVRLLVGSLIVCTVHKNGLWLSLDKQLLNEMKDKQDVLEEREAWHWDNGDWSEYKMVPSKNGYYIPSSKDLDIWPLLRDLHFDYIKKAANKYEQLRIDSQKKHSPELLVYLSTVLGQSIPCPRYGDMPEDNVLKEIEEFKVTCNDLPETECESIIQSRIGQGVFRSGLIGYWKRCAVTGCNSIGLLRASHIKPWKDSDNAERLDIYNGLLFVPNLDSAFDRGYISFDNEGRIIISDELSEKDRNLLGIHPKMKLRKIEVDHIKYLNYHKQEVFGRQRQSSSI